MYALHQSLQVLAICFIGAHFLLVALTSTGFNWGPSIGKVALIGLLTEIILALSPRIRFFGRIFRLKYRQWKLIHRFTGLFFLIAILHTFRVHPVMNSTLVVYLYVRLISFTGAGIYLYKELFERFFKKNVPYIVERVNHLNASVVEVSLKPAAEQLRHRAGQFLFIISSRVLADTSPPRYLPAARIIALFPDSLQQLVRHGELNDRLASVFAAYPIRVPPIRDRKRAVLGWAYKILAQEAGRRDRMLTDFTPDAEQSMLQHEWPGNISEMRQCISSALDKTDKEWLTPVDLGIFKGLSPAGPGSLPPNRAYLQTLVEAPMARSDNGSDGSFNRFGCLPRISFIRAAVTGVRSRITR